MRSHHSLTNLVNGPHTDKRVKPQQPALNPYRRFANRLRQEPSGPTKKNMAQRETILNDPAIVEYFNHLKTVRDNNGQISRNSIKQTVTAARQFIQYTGLEFSGHSIKDLVDYKRNNPQSADIEQALRAYSLEPPIKSHYSSATRMLGVFRANFAPLNLRINNHFPQWKKTAQREHSEKSIPT
jgi:hypothetical protein